MKIDSAEKLAMMIDHTNLKPDATLDDIEKLCSESEEHNFKSVCVNPSNVRFASELLKDEKVDVCTVVGYPLGANTTKIKFFEAKNAIEAGATEIDMVMNIGTFKSKLDKNVLEDIQMVLFGAKEHLVKVIIETTLLSNEEIVRACNIIEESGAGYIKTSTGISYPGARIENIKLIKENIKSSIGIKASGGIKDLKTTIKMIDAGATRIGTSSGVKILKEFE